MNTARIVVLTIAIGAGGIAAYLASGSQREAAPAPVAVQQIPTVDVLVAKADIGLGQTATPDNLQWQTWTNSSASSSFIRKKDRPEAIVELAGSIARGPFIAGEPIREQKLVKANGSGFMAAILPTGMRAVSTEISAETGAGGFILPNDRVDVILSKREKITPVDGPASRNHLIPGSSVQSACSRHRPGSQGKRRAERGVGQDGHAGNGARRRADFGKSPYQRHAVVGAAQHCGR